MVSEAREGRLAGWDVFAMIFCSRETEVQEGGRDEHQQTQPWGTREKDCYQADQHGEEPEDE